MRDFKDKDYPVPQLTEEERLAKGRQYGKRFAQISQQAEEERLTKEQQRLRSIPVQGGTDSVN